MPIVRQNPEITQAYLREHFSYDAMTGEFIRNSRPRNSGWLESTGYRKIGIHQKAYYVHRLIWLYVIGEWPKNKIDHRDGIGSNNAWGNLRDASDEVNAQNLHEPQKNNKVGFLGVYKKRKRFIARIYANGAQKVIGSFDTPELAHQAYVEQKRILHQGCNI